MKEFESEKAIRLLRKLEEFYEQHNFSSSHFLFLPPHEREFFASQGYAIRESFQYHFTNRYSSFDDFLSDLKSKKAKHVRQERLFKDVIFRQYTGTELTTEHAERMYEFYLTTIDKKDSQAYLQKEFFPLAFDKLRDHTLYVEALSGGRPVAGSCFFYDAERLLGRYWGCVEEIPNLHFELCYYQGMDFCLQRSIPLFEAGAQGEHKITRGFVPVTIYSAHKIKHPAFDQAIRNYITSEKPQVQSIISELTERIPFKKASN